MRKIPLESTIERAFCRWCAEQGIFQTKLQKNGWPDREIFLGDQHAFFIEFKRPGAKLTALQEHVRKLLTDRGYAVYVCHSREEAIKATQGEIQAKEASPTRHKVPGGEPRGLPRRRAGRRKDDDVDLGLRPAEKTA